MQLQDQPVFQLDRAVTDSQIRYFEKNGFIHFKHFVDKDTVLQFIEEVQHVEYYLLNNNISKVNGIPLKFGQDVSGKRIIQRIAFASQYSSLLSGFLRSERIQSLLALLTHHEGRIGESEKDGLVVNHYINTENSEYKQLGWHTDSPRDLFLGSKILPMLNVGLHLDDCGKENGGLRVLPGTHNEGLFTLLFKKKYFIDNAPDTKEVGFDIEAGDLTVHDGRIWHRVQQSPFVGERSRRRVMYIPVVTGAYQPKHEKSPTPFYHKLASLGSRKNKIRWTEWTTPPPVSGSGALSGVNR